MHEIIVVGGFNEVIELLEENSIKIIGIIDKNESNLYGKYKVIGTDSNAKSLLSVYENVPIIITIDNPQRRKILYDYYTKLGYKFSKIVSRSAKISKSSIIKEGSIIQSLVNISSEVFIGAFVRLNVMANVMHNSRIGDFTTIAPNAVVLGNVKIGTQCYVGANSTILPNLNICDNVVIGAGAVVTKHIIIPGTYVGAPAILKDHNCI